MGLQHRWVDSPMRSAGASPRGKRCHVAVDGHGRATRSPNGSGHVAGADSHTTPTHGRPLNHGVLGVEDDGDGTFRLADDNLICMRVPTRCARGARHRGGRRPGQTTRSVPTCPLSTRRQRPRPVVEVRVPANSVKSRRVVTTAERTHEATTRAERER